PAIHLDSKFLPNQTEVFLTAGSFFTLSCTGSVPVGWSSSAFRLQYEDKLKNPIVISKPDPRHTGTYLCGYTNQSLAHLSTCDPPVYPTDSSTVFVTPRSRLSMKQGQDFLFKCLLTDPSVTNLTLQPADIVQGRGRELPTGMRVTLDPKSGALIQNVQSSFNGYYACSGWKDGVQFQSKPFHLFVRPMLYPPSVFIHQNKAVRIEGETFEVTCEGSSTTHLFNLTWVHLGKKNFDVATTRTSQNSQIFISSTLTISAVRHEDAGTYTCKGVNEDGVPRQQHNSELLVSEFLMTCSVLGRRKKTIVSRRMVEAYEELDLTLTFVTESYPPVSNQRWIKATKESYSVEDFRSEASLMLRRVRQEDRGIYTFQFSNSFFTGFQSIDLQIYRSPSAVISEENNTLICSGSGYPAPAMAWYICPGVQRTCGNLSSTEAPEGDVTSQDDGESVRRHLNLPPSSDGDVTAECVASSELGAFRMVVHRRERHTAFLSPLIGAVSTAAFLFLLLLVVFYKWRQKPKYEIRWKIIESTEGNHYTFVDPSQLPYNYKWEFPRDKLRLGAILGSGAFGKVVEATAYGLGTNDVTRVAVKMLKPRAHSEEREALMSELKILSHLGYHDNIVNLLGACTQGGPMLMITEYCSYGDLLNFLRANAQDFMASILSADELEGEPFYKNMATLYGRLRSDSGISCCSDYQEMQPILGSAEKEQGTNTNTPDRVQMAISFVDLMSFSYQVAQGLDFLSTRNCIHRDVAARNVLLTDHRVAKICDFGLARDIQNDDSYIVQGNARLPVKWMAPESIFQCVYTVQSDVWSYGVLLWEIFSLGKSPYPNVAVDTNFYKMIKDGRHMTQPDFAPVEMYQLMTRCWSLEPTDRPTFKALCQLIDGLLQSNDDRPQQSYRNV
uniref:receptor protein-tyrosine kinase n=1 Tax=Tetraodon nigroviridis TaxID=99883 RepID=H3CQ92_TETNG